MGIKPRLPTGFGQDKGYTGIRGVKCGFYTEGPLEFIRNPRHPNVKRGHTGRPESIYKGKKLSLLRLKMARDPPPNVPKEYEKNCSLQ